ncbi:MAG: NCS2 family permease [Armatimonadota bacterium]|nr:NCS2 family permease [Armatimonadota bacterium]
MAEAVREPAAAGGWLENTFRLSERGTTVTTEVRAGLATFMVMAYIIFVNPSILGQIADPTGERLAFPAVLTVTCLTAGILSILMGLWSNYPFALAPGMGLNAVVAFQLVGSLKLTWPQAMTVIFLEGLVILLLVLTRFREAVMDAIPMSLKRAIGVGIGLFIALIGFVNAGFVVPGQGVPVSLGHLRALPITVFVVGLLITGWLLARRVKGALLWGILLTTAVAIVANYLWGGGRAFGASAVLPAQWIGAPQGLVGDGRIFGRVDFAFFATLGVATAVLVVFSIMLADFFDTMGTVVGISSEAGFLDERGKLPGIRRVLVVDSLGAAFGGFANSSSNTTYIESAAGVAEGGRTGLTSVVVGVLFLLAMFLNPLAGIIPAQATAPALILVGFFMMTIVKDIPWANYDEAIPAFVTMLVMPFTYSITNGIGAGFIVYTVLKLLSGKIREVHPLMLVSSLAFVIYFLNPA